MSVHSLLIILHICNADPSLLTTAESNQISKKQISVWLEEAASLLLGCFRHTDKGIFKLAEYQGEHIAIKEYAEAVTSYIAKCS